MFEIGTYWFNGVDGVVPWFDNDAMSACSRPLVPTCVAAVAIAREGIRLVR